jgi:hypothetical protein
MIVLVTRMAIARTRRIAPAPKVPPRRLDKPIRMGQGHHSAKVAPLATAASFGHDYELTTGLRGPTRPE